MKDEITITVPRSQAMAALRVLKSFASRVYWMRKTRYPAQRFAERLRKALDKEGA